jgi:hypothetical protein
VNLVLKGPNDAPYQAGRDFSVLISFDDAVTAKRADGVLQVLEQNLKEEQGRLLHQWWNTEVLAFTTMRELAALEAAAADMIIIAIREGRELPEMVATWMKRSLDLRKDRPGALVAMLDSDLKKPDASPGILSQLKQAAASGHMDFFATRAKAGSDQDAAPAAREIAAQVATARKNRRQPRSPGAGNATAQSCAP